MGPDFFLYVFFIEKKWEKIYPIRNDDYKIQRLDRMGESLLWSNR